MESLLQGQPVTHGRSAHRRPLLFAGISLLRTAQRTSAGGAAGQVSGT